jgi:hypothetical protein
MVLASTALPLTTKTVRRRRERDEGRRQQSVGFQLSWCPLMGENRDPERGPERM